MSLDFLTPSAADAPSAATAAAGRNGAGTPVARSPMESQARAAGARFELRDGWSIAVEYPGAVPADTVGWADTSHLPKYELQGELDESLLLGTAVRRDGAWWCRLTPTRALVIGGDSPREGALDVTSNFASLTLTGPLARETFARFCALDLRPHVTPVGALRPGSIARQPGTLIHEADERYLILFGWATGEYVWNVVADAGGHLGGRPIGADQLGALDA